VCNDEPSGVGGNPCVTAEDSYSLRRCESLNWTDPRSKTALRRGRHKTVSVAS
jgi:hypothetical protein